MTRAPARRSCAAQSNPGSRLPPPGHRIKPVNSAQPPTRSTSRTKLTTSVSAKVRLSRHWSCCSSARRPTRTAAGRAKLKATHYERHAPRLCVRHLHRCHTPVPPLHTKPQEFLVTCSTTRSTHRRCPAVRGRRLLIRSAGAASRAVQSCLRPGSMFQACRRMTMIGWIDDAGSSKRRG